MYAGYFGLNENPFNLTPDQKYLFLSHHHTEALDHLIYGIHERKGFIVISGGIGTGKTTLCRALLHKLEPSTKTALVFNPALSDMELLETINQELGIGNPGQKASKKVLLDRLNRYLLDNLRKNINTVLVLDEAQNLTAESLEQLRMLSNLETEKEKLIQIVFLGQPELMKLLQSPKLAQLNERITVRYALQPLVQREVGAYIEHRLLVAGNQGNVRFTKGAIDGVFSQSNGNPRRINAICDRALLIAYRNDTFTIDKRTVQKAVVDIWGNTNIAGVIKRGFSRKRFTQAVTAVAMLAIIANIAGWKLTDAIPPLFQAAKTITTVQAKAFFPPRDFVSNHPETHKKHIIREPIDTTGIDTTGIDTVKNSSVFLMDEQASLSALFKLFDVTEIESDFSSGDVYPGLFSFKGDPALYRSFVRPFRIRIKRPENNTTGYLLITRVTPMGAIGLDEKGREHPVTEEYLLTHWDGEMSWVYPYENISGKLTKGMTGLMVLKVQQMLQKLDYNVESRGVFDKKTYEEVMRFQLNLGLTANGIVDTSTKALLFQMTG